MLDKVIRLRTKGVHIGGRSYQVFYIFYIFTIENLSDRKFVRSEIALLTEFVRKNLQNKLKIYKIEQVLILSDE